VPQKSDVVVPKDKNIKWIMPIVWSHQRSTLGCWRRWYGHGKTRNCILRHCSRSKKCGSCCNRIPCVRWVCHD
jgi:hypothetical protein